MRSTTALVAAAAALALCAPAQASWRRAVSRHFIVYSEAPAGDLKPFVATLEQYDALLRLLSPVKPADDGAPLIVFQLADDLEVAKAARVQMAAGFYTVGPDGPMAVVPRTVRFVPDSFNARSIFFHEYAHHFMLENYTTVFPPWFVEGYAEFLSTTEFAKNGTASVGLFPDFRRAEIHDGLTIPLPKLLAADARQLQGFDGSRYYAEAWFLTHYLTFAEERQGQLRKYLALIDQGVPGPEAATRAFGDLAALSREFAAYRAKPTLPALSVTARQLVPGEVRIEPLSAGMEPMVPDLMLFMRGTSARADPGWLRDVEAKGRAAPADPAVQQLVADAEVFAGNLDAADAAADAVLTQDPKAVRALLRKGEVAEARLEKAKDHDPAHWATARGWFVRATKTGVEDAGVLMAYYQSFGREDAKPSEPAFSGLVRAYELAPQSEVIRVELGQGLIERKRIPEARVVLGPVAFSPHPSAMQGVARKLLAGLDLTPAAPATPVS